MSEAEDTGKERVSPYRLNLVPGEEQRRSQWNLIFVSDIPVTVDFYHTDMLEKVIKIGKLDFVPEKKREEGVVE